MTGLTKKAIDKSKLMKMGNEFYKQGMTRQDALKQAWALLKGSEVKVSGVTFGRRQEALHRLTWYNASDVSFTLERDLDNPYDRNAIAVVAAVAGKGNYVVGYLTAAVAKALAPIIDKNIHLASRGRVIGGGAGFNYGLRLSVA